MPEAGAPEAEAKKEPKAKAKSKGGKGKGKGKSEFIGPTGSSGYRLNVKNLSNETTTKEQLKALFEPFGKVSAAGIKTREDGSSRGFGYVILENEEQAQKAIAEMNGKTIGNKALNVGPAERRDPADDQGGQAAAELAAQQNAYMQQFWMLQQQQAYTAAMMGMGGMGMGMPGLGVPGMPPFPGMGLGMGMGLDPMAAVGAEYEGVIKSVNAKNGYGFILCEESYAMYSRDVYIDKDVLWEGAAAGDKVRFTVTINNKGHPKAETATKI